ncbi:ATP-dependent DNA helicase PIF1 [Halotydeus destructor]|nr:ATP-dependent DNA helicase PIF1 [Halotydeus destructor]
MASVRVPDLSCVIRVDSTDERGNSKSISFPKNGKLKILRDENRNITVKAIDGTNSHKSVSMSMDRQLNSVKIHSSFVNSGKASIVSTRGHCRTQLMISNCPPSELKLFLNALGLKAALQNGIEQCTKKKALFADQCAKRVDYEKISPLSLNDLKRARTVLGDKSNKESSPRSSNNKKRRTELFGGIQNYFGTHSLTSEQSIIAEAAVNSSLSIFFTGSAGTGKSHLLRYMTHRLPPETTMVTASTGIAASHINGMTLHTFAGIGHGKGSLAECISAISGNERKLTAWKKVKTLIIDEISMVDGDFFDKLEQIARTVRNSTLPFGGIQLILCGDFLQLPPVQGKGERKSYCFQANSWSSCIRRSYNMRTVLRQRDTEFVKLLEKIRKGICDEQVTEALLSTVTHKVDRDDIIATRLCTHKNDVDVINGQRLDALDGEVKVYRAHDSHANASILDGHCPSPRVLSLKLGTQVILSKNTDVSRGLVNGARGVVVNFERRASDVMASSALFPVVKFASGLTVLIAPERWMVRLGAEMFIRTQIPLNLAWGLSIHKSQGMSLDCVEISLSRTFECGQAYVALSRARTFQGLRISDFSPDCIKADPVVLQFYQTLA